MVSAFITLGRNGDCLNTLPLVFHDFLQGNKPTMVVSKPYAGLLSGVSYCDTLVWNGDYSTPGAASKWVEHLGRFGQIYTAQCYGTSHKIECSNFCEEAWRLVGKHHLWGTLPLVFDRRNAEREAHLVSAVGSRGEKPMVLVSTEGISSPFRYGAELFQMLTAELSDQYDFVNLSAIKAHQFYDLLALYEKAFCLISTDSGPLHLAQATPNLPVIAIVTDQPTRWHGSPERPNHSLRITYSEFQRRKGEIIEMLKNPIAACQQRLFHVWNDYSGRSAEATRRHLVAKKSWELEYHKGPWKPHPVWDYDLTRDGTSVGESKALPFVNDLIDHAANEARANDVIVLSNDDGIFTEGFTASILKNVPCWGARWEHSRVTLPITQERLRMNSFKHCGADIFAFTKSWWIEHRASYPQFILAREAWDLSLRVLINLHGGREVDGLCAHLIHNPEWHSPKYRECQGNLFNRASAVKFFAENNMGWPRV